MATRFMTTHKSNNAAINDLADRSEKYTAAEVVNTTTTTLNLTAAQLLAGFLTTTASGALTINFPTAAAIVAALPNAQVGSQFVLYFRNDGDNTTTFGTTGSTGVTYGGTTTVATTLGQILVGKVTAVAAGAETVNIDAVFKVAN